MKIACPTIPHLIPSPPPEQQKHPWPPHCLKTPKSETGQWSQDSASGWVDLSSFHFHILPTMAKGVLSLF